MEHTVKNSPIDGSLVRAIRSDGEAIVARYQNNILGTYWQQAIFTQVDTEQIQSWENLPNPESAELLRVIRFAITLGIGAALFLTEWQHGDTSEWPDFSTFE